MMVKTKQNGKSNVMNILLVGPSPTAKGGISSVLQNYLSYYNWKKSEILFLPTYIDGGKAKKILFFIKSLFQLNRILKINRIDIAHINMAKRGSFFRKEIIAKKLMKHKIKIVLHHHAEFNEFYANLPELVKKRVCNLFDSIDVNIVLSEKIKSDMIQKFPKSNFDILYNAVPTCLENPYKHDSTVILFLGRLCERKGVYDLIKTIQRLHPEINPAYTFALCGDGDCDKVSALIDKLGLKDRIYHIGWIDNDQKKDILNKTVLHVLPSYSEGLPMSILETMSLGIPNISSNIAAIPEVISDGVNGFLIEPGNLDVLHDRILYVLQNDKCRSTFSEKSYSLIYDDFSLTTHIEKLENIYTEVLKVSVENKQ